MIVLPTHLSAPSALDVIFVCQEVLATSGVVEIEAGRLQYVDPMGMAMLGACLDASRKQDGSIRVHHLSSRLSAYLQRMDVFTGLELVDCAANHGTRRDRSADLFELRQLCKHGEVGEVAHRLALAIIGEPAPDDAPDEMSGYTRHDRLVEPLQYALNELLENALTHARRGNQDACVWVASQYYRDKDIIRLGVVDNGCGFLATLAAHPRLQRKQHLDAILLALEPRISCNRDVGLQGDSVNQGVGLTTTCRIAEHAGGRMILASGNAMHSTSHYSKVNPDAYWQGVAIAMEVKRSKLVDIRFRELLPSLEDIPAVKLRFE